MELLTEFYFCLHLLSHTRREKMITNLMINWKCKNFILNAQFIEKSSGERIHNE